MDTNRQRQSKQFNWRVTTIYAILTIVFLFVVFAVILRTSRAVEILQFALLMVGLAVFTVAIVMLLNVFNVTEELAKNGSKLKKIPAVLEKNRTELVRLNRNARLSETAKSIGSRDVDRQLLQGAVFDKLQQQDFDAAYEIIDEVVHATPYQELAE